MKNRKIKIIAFVMMSLLQFFIPAKMIWDSEAVITEGVEYKFKTTPIDPNDPFRGKYITLRFDERRIQVSEKEKWAYGEYAYIVLGQDQDGFAKIEEAKKTEPTDTSDYIRAKVNPISSRDEGAILIVQYPFNRFYMEESKAYEAEKIHNTRDRDNQDVTYALVSVKNGKAVLKDVLINGVPIKEIVEERRSEN